MRMVVAFTAGLGLSLASCVVCSLIVFGRKSTLEFLRFFFGFGSWRYRCPSCEGTGICHTAGRRMDHSCCGSCQRIEVPSDQLPAYFRPRPDGRQTAVLGAGFFTGSLWDVLRHGRWQPAMHQCPDAVSAFLRRKS